MFRFRQGLIPGSDFATTRAKVMGPLLPFDVIGFSQFRVQQPMRELQTPQVYVYAAHMLQGVGGLVQGNIVFQPLGPNTGA